MKVTGIKTHKITSEDTDILKILDKYIKDLPDRSVVVVTSKIVSITEGRVVPLDRALKDELAEKEAQWYLPRSASKYDFMLTIKNNMIIASSGIDESNGFGNYILWPKDPFSSANKIREHLVKKFGHKNVGVIITDSKLSPLRWGVTGYAISYSGFEPLKSYIGKPDIFGRKLKVEKLSILDSLAAASVAVMGEGKEQMPLAIIEDIPFVEFQKRNPTEQEINNLKIDIEDDVFAPLLKSVKWKKGRVK